MPFESVPIIPTEPIPIDLATPLTYPQGERIIQLLTDIKDSSILGTETIQEKIDTISPILETIKTNTIPVIIDPVSNPSGIAMTYEQGQVLIDSIATIQHLGLVVALAVTLVFVAKFFYKLVAGTFLGGL